MRTALQSWRLIAGYCRFQRVGFSVVVLGFAASLAAADPAKRMFNIEAKPATQSLTDYARQAHTQLGYDVDIVDDILTNAVVGEYDSAEALELLLEDTGLEAEHGERGIFIRRVAKREVSGDIEEHTPPVAQTNSLRFAQASAAEVHATVRQNQTSGRTGTHSGEGEERRPLEEIIVTGTNIRGIAPDSSPTRTFTREDIQISGAGTAQDFIQTLPANFGGGSNADIVSSLPNDDSTRFNDPFNGGSAGSSVNLHGLGSGATLVLLNGHRLAPSSGIGDFVDISMIPASALERVEVLSDGASSIYGGDAVAGVVNFILRDDFDGAEASLRHGTVTDGDMNQYRASLTGGENWDTGHALAVYEYFGQGNLSAEDRAFSQGALLPNDLLSKQKRHSALASASQEITPDLELSGDVTLSDRETVLDSTTVTGNSSRATSESESWNISAGGSWMPHNSWNFDFFGTYSNAQTDTDWQGIADLISRTVKSELWTGDARVSGTVMHLPGGDVKLALGGHYRSEAFSNVLLAGTGTERNADRDVYAFFGEAFIPVVGSDNPKPGIARFEINASGRFDNYSDFGSTANPKIGVLWSPFEGLNLRGSYSESFNPPPLGRVGASDIAILAYPSLTFNTLLGQTPGDPSIADVDIMSVNGTSKNLDAEESRAFTAGIDLHRQWRNHQFSAKSTYFDIKFDGRLSRVPVPSIFDVPNIAFNNPELYPEGTVIYFPTLDQIQEVLNSADLPITSLFGADPLNASVINFSNVVRNLSLTLVRGVDFEVAYALGSGEGTFSLGLDGTYLIDFQQQAAVTTPKVGLLNTQYNPVNLVLRGRAAYANNGLSANLFLNYKNDYRVDNTPSAVRIDSWTTVDLSLSYDTRQTMDSLFLQNAVLRFSVINLFNEGPPSTPGDPSFNIFGYDPTNASPLGRFVAFELTKRF